PAAAGGTTDLVGRLIATKLSVRLDEPVVVENKAGAGGTIGAAQVAAAKPDGCTMLMGNVGPNAINYSLHKKLAYVPADLIPVTDVFAVPNVLVVNPGVPAASVAQLIELARSQPGRLALANSGTGQSTHMTAEMFRLQTGVDVIQVPYKGNAPAVADLLAGQVQMMFDNVAVSLPHIKAGKLRALAVSSAQRVEALPDVPTLSESGLKGFDVSAWFGLFYPAGTDAGQVESLHRDVVAILQDPVVRRQISNWSGVPGGRSPADFGRYVESEIDKWREVVRSAHLAAQ
ncbi:Bug family tripartite tricarboxylate transporter substrate binding protein, partial [Bordetella tumulicola]|uniref:Bug family tripartite tricarboxylate transporter substrate binding protein n=1 Tax=Bordetella tumulicola TaxID=1649133 RepID=UPI0039F049D3